MNIYRKIGGTDAKTPEAPEEKKKTAEPKACEGDRRRLYFRAVGEPLGVRVHAVRPNKSKAAGFSPKVNILSLAAYKRA